MEPVGFSLLVDPTWTLLGYVSCMITQNSAGEISFWPIFYNGS